AFEERLLVTEVAHVRTAARNDDRIRDEIEVTLDELAPDRRDACERSNLRSIDATRAAAPEIGGELRPRNLAGAQKDRVGVRRGLFRERRDMQSAERYVSAALPVVICKTIRAVRGSDVDLNDDQIGCVVYVEPLHVLVLNRHLIVLIEKAGQRGQTQRREQ